MVRELREYTRMNLFHSRVFAGNCSLLRGVRHDEKSAIVAIGNGVAVIGNAAFGHCFSEQINTGIDFVKIAL
jgi:hypothetical protein